MCLEEGARWVLENEQGQASGCHLVVPPRQNGWVKWRRNKVKDIIWVSNAYCSLYLRWVTWNKARKLIFAVSNPKSLWMKKHHLNNYWTGEYISFFFSVPFTPCKPPSTSAILSDMRTVFQNHISECGCKKSLFSDNQVIITYWLKKIVGKFTFLKHLFFGKDTVTVNLKKFSLNTIFRLYTCEKFYITTMQVILEIKILLLRNEKYLHVTYPISVVP